MIDRDQLREINRLVAEYEHPGILHDRRDAIRIWLRSEYGVEVEDLERSCG